MIKPKGNYLNQKELPVDLRYHQTGKRNLKKSRKKVIKNRIKRIKIKTTKMLQQLLQTYSASKSRNLNSPKKH